ncbi:MAG TPA: nitrous oxidase accessory protein NosD [Bacillus bacterium]|nr:nitrous oxidase accessory protein NosD [Bacillus sp. (in: firmicutes)]
MKWQTYFLLLLAIFFFSSPASAEEFIVNNEHQLQTVLETAVEHDTVTIKEGIYKGNFTVNMPMTIKGEEGATIIGPNKGDVITVNADDVTIENLQIEGSGSQNAGIHVNGNRSVLKNNKLYNVFHGIVVKKSYGHQIEHNAITSYLDKNLHKGHGIYLIEAPHSIIGNNTIFNTNDGIYLSYSNSSEISRNIVSKTRYGIHTMDSVDVVIYQNEATQNRNGLMIMQSKRVLIKENYLYANTTVEGAGIFLFDTFDSTILTNIIKKNNKGIYFENGIRNTITFNEFDENDKGMEIGKDSDENQIYLNNFLNNNEQIITDKKNENVFSRDGFGNYWDDQYHLKMDRNEPTIYASVCTSNPAQLQQYNRDETNAYAYKSGDVFYHLTTSQPYLQLFSGSPAVRLWNTIEQFVPIPSKQFIVDEYPIQMPVVIEPEFEKMNTNEQNLSEVNSAVNVKKGGFFLSFMSLSFLILWMTRRMKNDA